MGMHLADAAEDVDLAGMRLVVEHADAEEEHAGDRAVGEHLQRRAGERRLAEVQIAALVATAAAAATPSSHVAHVADAGVGDHLLHVALHHRGARAPQDVDGGDDAEPGRNGFAPCGTKPKQMRIRP